MDAARKVADQIKRNGEFDKCRREVLAKVLESECMKRSIEECHRVVKNSLRHTSSNASISRLREVVKDGIRRRNLVNPLLNKAERAFHEYESSSKLHEMIEEISRSELGLPPLDSNIELVDMEVSSGASSSSSSSCSVSASASHSVPEEHADNMTLEAKDNIGMSLNEERINMLTPSPPLPPPPPPLECRSVTPSPPPLIKQPKTPPSPNDEYEFDKDKHSNSKRKRYSSIDDEVEADYPIISIKAEISENVESFSPRCAFISRSPSIISDDSLPPYSESTSALQSESCKTNLHNISQTSERVASTCVSNACEVEEISDSECSNYSSSSHSPDAIIFTEENSIKN